METKRCSKCKKVKFLTEFHWNVYRYRSECKVCRNSAVRLYDISKDRRKCKREYQKKRYHGNPEVRFKDKARQKLRYYVSRGVIKRGACVVCGKGKAHAHHEDYSKPFDVIWLCRQHHTDLHKGHLKVEDIRCT